MIDPAIRLTKHRKVVYRSLGDGAGGVLLHLETGQYYGLNTIGALIWNFLDGQRTLGEILAEVRALVRDTPPGLADDLASFVVHLRDRNLVQVADPTRP